MSAQTLAKLIEEIVGESDLAEVSWFSRKFSRIASLLRRDDFRDLGSFKALGFPVRVSSRMSDDGIVFDLFVFDLEIDGTQVDNPVGRRVRMWIPPKTEARQQVADQALSLLIPTDESTFYGEVAWIERLGGWTFVVEDMERKNDGS